MQITISNITTAQTVMLDVPGEMTIADLKALVSAELPSPATSSAGSGDAPHQMSLYHNGKLVNDGSRTLDEVGVTDGDMLAIHTHAPTRRSGHGGQGSHGQQQQQHSGGGQEGRRQGGARERQLQQQQLRQQQQQQQIQQQQPRAGAPGEAGGGPGTGEPDPEVIRLQVLGDPRLMEELRRINPELAGAVNDQRRFRQVFEDMERQRREAEQAKVREIALLNDDPFNPESQARIAELIRQEQVMENLQSALEHNPEAFGKVIMLYIPVEVNGTPIKAFVDSGAQATIMSPRCAEACNIMRLIDARFAGIARGVGTAKILGRVHSAQIKIGDLFLACSFTVMEGKGVDLLLGLDMLKRHQAKIDLEKGWLEIGGSRVEFLGEAEIPKGEWENAEGEGLVEGDESMIDAPGVGGSSGALAGPPAVGAPAPVIRETPAVAGFGVPQGGQLPQQQQHQQAPQPGQQMMMLPQQPPGAYQHSGYGGVTRFSEEAIGQLQSLGFSRAEAIAALQATGGDVDMAASLLFN